MEKKKNPEVDINKKRPTLLLLGLIGAFSFSLMAFEWKTPIELPETLDPYAGDHFLEEDVIPVTYRVQKKVEAPKQQSVTKVIVQVLDDEPIPIDPEEEFEPEELDDEPALFIIGDDDEEGFVEPDAPFITVEQMPEFPGGELALFGYIGDQIDYPTLAREVGVDGTVYVTFVVEKDGSVSNVEVLKGIGAGCDEEAARVIESLPKWSPGEQRGRPVRVQFNMPIVFKLK